MNKSVYTVILARLGSTRLPSKMIKDICGISVIEFLIKRAQNLKSWPNVILATSDKQKDDKLEELAIRSGIEVFRGPENDVAKRFALSVKDKDCEWIHRLNGDNVFFDFEKINEAMAMINDIDNEIISNVNETHISGFSVEIINRDSYDNAYKMMNLDEKEHVTKYFYRSKDKKIFWMKNRSALRPLALDTEDDYKKIIKLTNNPYNFSFETPVSKMIDALK
jgi:spore coat polysaccharide biosynthesis protein SpsF (cytidylyltransferase family)